LDFIEELNHILTSDREPDLNLNIVFLFL
jgi:hypothetical protein